MGRFRGRKKLLLSFGGLAVLLLILHVYAGSLEPPGPPGPTFRTLGEIYDLLVAMQAGGETVGTETRLKGCMTITRATQGSLESTDPNDRTDPACGLEPGSIRVIAVDHEVNLVTEPGQPQGTRQHAAFRITKHVDDASVLLYQALVTQEPVDVRIRWYRQGQGGLLEHYFSTRLTGGYVAGVSPTVLAAPGSFYHLEDVSFVYTSITWTDESTGSQTGDPWRPKV